MRTTVAIADQLLRTAKREARLRGLSLGGLIEAALRRELSRRAEVRAGPAVPVFREGRGVRPGIDITSNRALLEALDEGQPVEHLR